MSECCLKVDAQGLRWPDNLWALMKAFSGGGPYTLNATPASLKLISCHLPKSSRPPRPPSKKQMLPICHAYISAGLCMSMGPGAKE